MRQVAYRQLSLLLPSPLSSIHSSFVTTFSHFLEIVSLCLSFPIYSSFSSITFFFFFFRCFIYLYTIGLVPLVRSFVLLVSCENVFPSKLLIISCFINTECKCLLYFLCSYSIFENFIYNKSKV